jgi:hypothetical protein
VRLSLHLTRIYSETEKGARCRAGLQGRSRIPLQCLFMNDGLFGEGQASKDSVTTHEQIYVTCSYLKSLAGRYCEVSIW